MSNQVQRILNELAAGAAGSYGSYESASYEDQASYESFLVSSGMSATKARIVAENAVKQPAIAMQIKQAMSEARGGGWGGPLPGGDAAIAAAQFQFSVKRITATIAEDLPFVIFGSQDAQNGYRNIIPSLLPAGVVLTSVEIGEVAGAANANRALFTYTQGANVDTIEVTSSTYSYPSLLNSTNADLLKLSKIRMELSNSTLTRQFNLELASYANSPFGKGEQNRVTPASYKRPDQYQNGIVDMDIIFRIDKETSMVGKLINTTGFQVDYNCFVEKFYRQNAKGF